MRAMLTIIVSLLSANIIASEMNCEMRIQRGKITQITKEENIIAEVSEDLETSTPYKSYIVSDGEIFATVVIEKSEEVGEFLSNLTVLKNDVERAAPVILIKAATNPRSNNKGGLYFDHIEEGVSITCFK